jgi:hypothetical protein
MAVLLILLYDDFIRTSIGTDPMQGRLSVFTVICAAQGLCINSHQLALSEHVDSLHPVNKIVMELVWFNTRIMRARVASTGTPWGKNRALENNQDDLLHIAQ